MPGCFVIERKRLDRSRIGSNSYLNQTGRKRNPLNRAHSRIRMRQFSVHILGMQWVRKEGMLDVGGDQFLMLLFMLNTKSNPSRCFFLDGRFQ